ncbi:MAG: hypothetical protein A3B89_00455 [Candidatus Buchananbacteria bacterium RIFCSPHIGHO2_02_FULL_40_13]|uniref:Glycosyl transferase family 1 domain-containing protein n=1 Tax=Candidatus Buchananbacteria bacterium RIFCSPLOWO2_01_FULL_39_33 TaxID=1797543 RepID=A0A1G1YIS9_9BACT|nr:MAG: hypothetical protein A3B89_00455 [Candidatus Buchananbacteria bacterium RIFCSPHIGHO2_02_FULL_40_13]OGY51377.1 MAG: hypothetical protein A3A02_00445 [Candidatus Buchananbacteria bacterium RIFCSPLOWO2_01_FULL_39_33]
MITRKVDNHDALAGFAYNWVKKLGANLNKLYVISWQAGDSRDLPENIEVVFLPKNKFAKIFILPWEVFKLALKVDGVFCHMNPEYTILSWLPAKIFGKRIVSWYTHKQINWKRRLLELLTDKILTASKDSFRQPWFKNKVEVTGHGIDIEQFKTQNSPPEADAPLAQKLKINEDFNIISVGRISPTKDYESIIKALDILGNKQIHLVKSGEAGLPEVKFNRVKLKIIGDVILEVQRQYLDSLKQMVVAMDLGQQVEFVGWVANQQMPPYYQEADLFINMSGTGSVDKVVLEAMACQCLVLTSNEAFREILPKELMVEKNNPQKLAEKIKWLMDLPAEEKEAIIKSLRKIVVNDHNLDKLVLKIINQFK